MGRGQRADWSESGGVKVNSNIDIERESVCMCGCVDVWMCVADDASQVEGRFQRECSYFQRVS